MSSSPSTYVVRAIEPSDHAAWLGLWRGYCDFYQVTIPEHVTNTTWGRILGADHPIYALLATSSSTGAAAGFANYVLHPFTWSERPACYLEDLFVRSELRGSGVGYALLQHLMGLSLERHWGRVYWTTRENNHAARRLYDRFCLPDGFVRYVVSFDGALPD